MLDVTNLDLSDYITDGLRWNLFFETYDSDLLEFSIVFSLTSYNTVPANQ